MTLAATPIVRSLDLAPDLASLRLGRDFVGQMAREAGFSEDAAFDIIVAASEAIANAIEHTPVKGQVEVTATIYPDRLEVQVEGPGEFQAPRRLEERAHRGLGLPLMAKLADHLALYSGPRGGTLVSLTFYRPGAKRDEEALPPSVRELIEQNQLTSAITENAPVGIYVLGPDLRYRWANKTYHSYLDEPYRSADLTGVALTEAVPGAVESGLVAEMQEVSQTGRPSSHEDFSLTGYQRGPTWWWRRIVALRGEKSPPPYDLLVVVSEETERKRLEQELGQREREAQHIIEHAPSPVYQLDFQGPRFAVVNEAMCRHSGYSREELLGISPLALLDDQSSQKLQERIRTTVTGEEFSEPSVDYTCITKDGRRRSVVFDLSLMYQGGKAAGALVVVHDITERKRVEEELRRSEERQALLLGLNDILRTLADPVAMRYEAARMLGEYAGADRAYFAEAEIDQDAVLVLRDHFNKGLAGLAGTYRISDYGGIYRVLAGGRPFTVRDVATSGRLSRRTRAGLDTLGIRAMAAVPLAKSGEKLWTVNLAFSRRHDWTRDELALMREVGDRTWNAVERAQAEAALRESEERHRLLAAENERLYRQQLDIAENLQLALLNIPSEIGPVKLGHLYRSATEAARVGGDFYDVFEVKEGHVAIIIGDVAGHGIQAARTATLVKDVVHAFTHQSLRTHEVLRRTNLLLIEKDLPGFVTVFLGILDRYTGSLRYSSAGHPEAPIRRASGEIERLGCGYSPLGVYPEAGWKAHELDLHVDDLLVLYTDGVTEARRNEELFGEKRLERLLRRKRLSPQRLPHLVLDQVLAFAGGKLKDDVAVLALSLAEVSDPRREEAFRQESLLPR
jgi:PAS domain S-box-containing protein